MDKVDYAILRCLYENCRVSYETLGRKCEVTSTTIKNRIKRLRDMCVLGRYFIRLSYSAYCGQELLIIIETSGIEERGVFIEKLGRHLLIESVSPCLGNVYLAQAICRNVGDYSQLQSFFNGFAEINSVDVTTVEHELVNKYRLTNTQIKLLVHLIDNPRKELNAIAELIGKSPKGVNRALQKLRNLNLVELSAECFLSSFVAMIKYDNGASSLTETQSKLAQEFDCILEIKESLSKSLVYVSFFADLINEIFSIQRKLKKGGYRVIRFFIVGPKRYFHSSRDEELRKMGSVK